MMILIIMNITIDYIILSTCSYILKNNTSFLRLLLSSLFGLSYLISLYINFNNFELIVLKVLISSFMIIISFGFNDFKTLIRNLIYFFIVNYFLGGMLYYLKTQGFIKYKYIIFFIPIIMNIYKYFSYNLKNIFTNKYKVTIYLNNGKILYLNGYMDTGNNLIEPYGNRKVIIINKKIKENYYLVPYSTIDNESLLKCFNPKKVYIDGLGERNDISIGIVNKRFIGFNCLLNNKLLEEK